MTDIYLYEPRDDRRLGIIAELTAGQMTPVEVDDRFFGSDLGLLSRKGSDTRPFLMAQTPRTLGHIRNLRTAGCHNPVLVLRDHRDFQDTAIVLDGGADDDFVVPLKAVELRSRINSITRRAYGHAAESITIGEITAYLDGRDPDVAGQRVKLSRREHAIFQHLVLNAPKVLSKAAIYDSVYGLADEQPYDKVIDVYICKIRKKLAAATPAGQLYIETVYGRGYKFAAPQDVQQAAPHKMAMPH